MLKVENLIYTYLYLCACMMIFNIIYMFVVARIEKNKKKNKNHFVKNLNTQLGLVELDLKIRRKHKRYLYNKLKTPHNLLLLEYTLDQRKEETISKYKKQIQDVFYDLSLYYENTDKIKKAYFAYIVYKYKIKKILPSSLFGLLEEESIYSRDNGLKAIVTCGNIENIIKALKIVDKSAFYFYPDSIFKGLINFEGDKGLLTIKLLQEYKEFSDNMRIAIIRYINYIKLDYKEDFYNLYINNTESTDVKIELIRYFSNNIYELAMYLLINIVNSNEKDEVIVEAAIALKNYNSTETIEALKQLLHKNDWNIKNAASESLIYLGASYYDLIDIYNGDDKVARSILKYKVQSNKINLNV